MTPKILTVDDSKTIRLLLARMLRPFQVEVVEGGNGEEGLQTALREKPSLIILDYNMPVMDGIAFIKAVRAQSAFKGVPVLMLTTESQQAMKDLARAAGATGWLVKPFNPEMLLRVIAKVVN